MTIEIRRIHPYVESADSRLTGRFYRQVFDLEVAMEAPVVGLRSAQVPSAQLIVTPSGMETPQPHFGIDVGEAPAVDTVHERVRAAGMHIVYPLTNEPWGVRRFFFEDPDGSIVNVLAHIKGPDGH